MKKRYAICIGKIGLGLLTALPFYSSAQQSSCANSDFSEGTFRNWVGYTSCYPFDTPGTNLPNPNNGVTPPAAYYYKEGIVEGRHTIITTSTPDIYTCGNLMTLPPNEKSCARLGNGGFGSWGDGVGWQREFLNYTFSITPSNPLLVYKFAAVFQDAPYDPNGIANHTKALRPRFIISVKDGNGNFLDTCGNYETYADSTIPGYRNCKLKEAEKLGAKVRFEGDMVYSPWKTVGLDLRKYIGQKITIGFETWDCGLGGHFGYAYITAKCGEMKIYSNNCSPGKATKLTAPEGFYYLWSTGDSTQSITIDSAKLGDSVEVKLFSKLCNNTTILKSKIFENYRVVDFDVDSISCAGIATYFKGKSEDTDVSWYWDFDDGSTANVQNPVHTFNTAGIYDVRLIVNSSNGCADTINKRINVCPGVGIQDDAKQTASIYAYPNPSTGTFKMELANIRTGAVQVFVTNILGKTIYAENNFVKGGVLQNELDIQEQPDGIYFLTIKNTERSSVVRLIKKN